MSIAAVPFAPRFAIALLSLIILITKGTARRIQGDEAEQQLLHAHVDPETDFAVIDANADDWLNHTIADLTHRQHNAADVEEQSPYDFGYSWANKTFEERWLAFREAVPLSKLQDHWDPSADTGPACYPSLLGPSSSEHLAILIHGFTSCPATLDPVTKKMLAAGFRVLRPTLPGHGRKWTKTETSVCHFDGSDESTAENCTNEKMTSVRNTDDLSEFPEEPGPYLYFADALGKLAEQFKAEHPTGKVVVLGHSLGGIVAAKLSLERPKTVDRLLLMNPMFGLSTHLLQVLKVGSSARVSWSMLGNADCEEMRGKNSGGNCQFKVANVMAMSNLAYVILCKQWGLEEACRWYNTKAMSYLATGALGTPSLLAAGALAGAAVAGPFGAIIGGPVALMTGLWAGGRAGAVLGKSIGRWAVNDTKVAEATRRGFADLQNFQVVATYGDAAVDNKRVERLVDEVDRQRKLSTGVADRTGTSYCYWPSSVTHCYNNDKDEPSAAHWFHPYIEESLSRFLTGGHHVDIVRRAPLPWKSTNVDRFGWCLDGHTDVAGNKLAVLPAVQHKSSYELGASWPMGLRSVTADVMFVGDVRKQSETLGTYHWRSVELLEFQSGQVDISKAARILVTRKYADDTVRDVFLLKHQQEIQGECVRAQVIKLRNIDKYESLVKQMMRIVPSGKYDSQTIKLWFCGNSELPQAICSNASRSFTRCVK